MKFVLLAIFLICCCGYAYAQKVTFSVIDSVNHTPVNDALIYFYTNLIPDNSMRLGTDSQGKVSVQLIRPGIIDTVVVEAYPYQRAAMQHINVINDTIISVYLNRATIDLEEVQVGFRGGARLANNKIIYHPYPSAFNKTRSVTELLPLIPNMAVRNGKFFFRNDGNFVILIDGMGENKTKEEQLSILQNMPVDAIHKVEIIDNPSARYGDGTVAVINFLTKKDVAYTSVRGSASSQIFHDGDLQDYPSSFDIAADARFRLGKNNLHFIARLGDHRALTAINTDQAYLLNYLRQTERMIKHDKSNQFSFVWDRKLSEHFTAQINTSYTQSNTLNQGTSAVNALQSTNESNFVTHNSEHMKNSRFTFTPQFKLSLNKANGTTIYMNPTYASLTILENNSYATENNEVAPINNSSLLGTKTDVYFFDVLIDNVINNDFLQTGFGYKYNMLQSYQRQGGDFNYDERQNTAFLTNAIKFKKTTINADFRIEHLDYTAKVGDTSASYTNYFFYPKLNLVYALADQQNITVGYERQLLRLSSIALNPQTRFTGFQRGASGNVDLQPRVTDHYFSRLYLHGHSFSINYKKHKNQRIFIPSNEEQPFIREQTTYNYFHQYYISYNKNLPVGRIWEVNTGLYYYLNRMKTTDFIFVNTKGDNIMLDVANDFTLGKHKFNMTFSYMSTDYFPYGEMKPVLYNSMSYSRLFLGDNLGVSLFIQDFLGLTRENAYNYHPLIASSAEYMTNQRRVSLQLSYRIPVGKKSRSSNYKTDRRDEIRL